MTGELRDIRKSYGRHAVLRGVSFGFERGDAVGIVGANGSGKSTLLRIAAGILKPQGGEFLWEGSDLLRSPAARQQLVAYVPQGTPLIDELSALDNLRLWYAPEALRASLESGMLRELGLDESYAQDIGKSFYVISQISRSNSRHSLPPWMLCITNGMPRSTSSAAKTSTTCMSITCFTRSVSPKSLPSVRL